MLIRPMTATDLPALRLLYLRARQISWPWLQDSSWTLDDFDHVTRDERVWVAQSEAQCVGFASVWEPDNFLHSLFVDPDCQGKGVGSALLQHVHTTFSDTGSLKCLVKNEKALGFYHRHGWQSISQGTSAEGDYWLMHYPRR
ncbi:GNAT family N-acetyltransferase [Enterobacteriaceae bacterium RIT691]|nr:GNAT family N-acetyltransferase [Enterobacteriaceae bacterium RIT691]